MAVHYIMFNVKPTELNQEAWKFAGAYVNCWIVSNGVESAVKIATKYLQEAHWRIVTIEDSCQVSPENYKDDPNGLEVYEQALIDKEIYTFHTYATEFDEN